MTSCTRSTASPGATSMSSTPPASTADGGGPDRPAAAVLDLVCGLAAASAPSAPSTRCSARSMPLVTPPAVSTSPSSTTRASITRAPDSARSASALWWVTAGRSRSMPAVASSMPPVHTQAMRPSGGVTLGQRGGDRAALRLAPGAGAPSGAPSRRPARSRGPGSPSSGPCG